MSQSARSSRTSAFELLKPRIRPGRLHFDVVDAVVLYSRISGYCDAAATIRARSFAVDTFSADSPVASEKRVRVMPSAAALRFIAATNAAGPPG